MKSHKRSCRASRGKYKRAAALRAFMGAVAHSSLSTIINSSERGGGGIFSLFYFLEGEEEKSPLPSLFFYGNIFGGNRRRFSPLLLLLSFFFSHPGAQKWPKVHLAEKALSFFLLLRSLTPCYIFASGASPQRGKEKEGVLFYLDCILLHGWKEREKQPEKEERERERENWPPRLEGLLRSVSYVAN